MSSGLHAFCVMMTRCFGPILPSLLVYDAMGEGVGAGIAATATYIACYVAVTLLAARIPAKCKTCGSSRRFSGWWMSDHRYRCETCGDVVTVTVR
jgi:cytochrome c biogenesis protein CcdA